MTAQTQSKLNGMCPSAAEARLGDTLNSLVATVNALVGGVANVITTAPTLVIKAGGGVLVKSSTAFSALVDGGKVSKAANTDMAALVGTLADTKFAAWAFYIGPSGTITTSSKTADQTTAALAIAALPATPENVAQIGYITVQNAQGSGTAFTGGTTALDATGITTTYYNAVAVDLTIPTLASR